MPFRYRRLTGALDEEVIVKHTDAKIEEAARRFETLADELDPETASVDGLADLRPSPRPRPPAPSAATPPDKAAMGAGRQGWW
jgi:hypothetical protein